MKITKSLCLIVLSLLISALISSCDIYDAYWESFCTHEYTTATCSTPQVCKKCGKETDKFGDHSWKGSCGADEKCSICGIYSGRKISHNWSEATCTSPKTCRNCGSASGQALGHNYDAPTTIKESSCQSAGILRYACQNCPYHYDEEIPATEHVNNDKHICTICGQNSYCGSIDEILRSYEIKVDWIGRKDVHHDVIDLNSYYDVNNLKAQGYTKITVQISLDIIRVTGIDNIYDGILGGYKQYVFLYPTINCPSGTLDESIMESTYPSLFETHFQHQSKKNYATYNFTTTIDLNRLTENRIYIRYDVGTSGAWKNNNLHINLTPAK